MAAFRIKLGIICLLLQLTFAGAAWCQEPVAGETPQGPSIKEQLDDAEQKLTELFNESRLDEAADLARKAVELSEQLDPPDPDAVAAALVNYAAVLQARGDLAEARPLLEKASRVLEKAYGFEHYSVAVCLTKLAMLLKTQADYQSALPLYDRALAITQREKGADSMEAAEIMTCQANLEDARGRADEAYALNKEVERIYRKMLGENPPSDTEEMKKLEIELADNLNDQAAQLISLERNDAAQPLLEQAIEMRKRLLPAGNPDTAESMNNLAMLFKSKKQWDKAISLLNEALEMSRKSLGPAHLNVGECLNNLGEVYAEQGDLPAAQRCFLQAADVVDKHVQTMLPNLSFAEQRQFLDNRIPEQTSLLLRVCRKDESLAQAYERLFRWKGLLIENLRLATFAKDLASTSQNAALLEKLHQLRAQISAWYLQSGTVSYEEWRTKNDELTSEKESLERRLAKSLTRGALSDSFYARSLADVLNQLTAEDLLVDFYLYHYAGQDKEAGWRYCAVVSGQKFRPALVDIGPASKIVDAISKWQKEVLASQSAKEAWDDLGMLIFDPLAKVLPSATKKVWICPDGELFRIPWQLLAERYETNPKLIICQGDSVRELSGLWSNKLAQVGKLKVFAAGGIDFGTQTGSGAYKHSGISVPPLPGTLKEIKDIELIAQNSNLQFEELIGKSATKAAVVAQLPQFDYAHLATHGLFLPENVMQTVRSSLESTAKPRPAPVPTRGIMTLPHYLRERKTQRNILVESALAFAGANKFEGGLSNFLTAEELLGLNLDRCRLLALSACETARGKEVTGQGVMGLRAAIMGAGAHSVLMSLWKVPDEPTVQLMRHFYTNLWQKKMSKVEALVDAQKQLRAKVPDLPVIWAAWILVGD